MFVSVLVSLCSPWRDYLNLPLRQGDFPVMSVTTDSKTFFPVSKSFSLTLITVIPIFIDDCNRVLLKGDATEEGSNYINASFIDVSLQNCCIIFSQVAPKLASIYQLYRVIEFALKHLN